MKFYMWGGYSYDLGEPEDFQDVRAACEAWADRHSSNGIRAIDGILYPTWGDVEDLAAVVLDEEMCCYLTKTEVLAIADGAEIPGGW